MRIVANLVCARRRSFAGCGLAIALVVAAPASAQVIEIGDDGGTRVFDGPTRFITGEIDQEPVRAAPPRFDAVDHLARAAQAERIDPGLLRAVAWAESRGRMSAVSPKGAVGVMQLMPATAAELGVDPRDPDANITGGARYLARMMARFRSLPLALAAYNAGPGAVLRWGGIPPFAETRTYVAAILSRWQGSPVVPAGGALSPARASSVNPMLIEVPSF